MRTIKRDIVGAVLISSDRHVLIGKNVKGGVYEELWVIPGGGIDQDETKEQALRREILEEVGIDISAAKKQLLPGVQTGAAVKTLRGSNEQVIVDMTFYNFRVDIDSRSSDIPIKLQDDLEHAEWVEFDDLKGKQYSPSVEELFKSLDLL